MKKLELESIKKCVKNGDYVISQHSYGTSSAGYLVNFKLFITDKTHQNTFNRGTYYVCFSSKTWFKVKYEGVFYNNHYLAKYREYDEEIEAVIYGDRETLSEKLVS